MAFSTTFLLLCILGAGLIGCDSLGRLLPGAPSWIGNRTNSSLGALHGNKTDIKDFPFIVSLKEYGFLWGSGVILNKRWVATTAYNAFLRNPDQIQIRAGSSQWNATGQVLGVEAIYVHPNYSTYSWENDIALIKTNLPIKFGQQAKPAILGFKSLQANTNASTAGWGVPTTAQNTSQYLLSSSTVVLSNETCSEIYYSLFTKNLLCTQASSYINPCFGDFGDPFVVEGIIYGMYAGSMTCDSGKYPLVYVSFSPFYDWIQSVAFNNTAEARGWLMKSL